MNRAWNEAMALISANRDVVLVVAGVFFFLPYVVLMMMIPDMAATLQDPAQAENAIAMMGDFYAGYWWLMALVTLVQGMGMLGLLALLTDHRRPTVAEALKIGFRKVFSYIGAYLIAGFAIALAAFVLIGLTAAVSTALAFVGVIALFLMLAYAMVKLSLVPAVLVKEDVANPITALSRSWRLTKGNSFRLFFFYFLIVLVMIVVVMLLSALVGFLLSLAGGEVLRFGNAVVTALMNAAWATGFLAVLSAVHDQLGGTSSSQIAETFE